MKQQSKRGGIKMLFFVFCVFLLFEANVNAHKVPLYLAGNKAIPGEYLVLMKPDPSVNFTERLYKTQLYMMDMRKKHEMQIRARYAFNTFAAFHVEANEGAIEVLRTEPSVKLIQENAHVTLFDVSWQSDVDLGRCVNQSIDEHKLWGLTKISSEKRQNYNSGFYHYDENGGEDVTAYIIDSGIYLEHEEFEGRAVWGYTAQNLTSEGDVDLNGHGTHVAGTVGGATVGVAKRVRLVAVKSLDEAARGTATSTIEAIVWTCNHFADNRQRDKKYKGVVNMSLGSTTNPIKDALISTCIDAGLVFTAAAGNQNKDACNSSPARVSSAITVGATDLNDTLAYFSNYGSCVDILAPGVDIMSAWITESSSLVLKSGTSMATPYVTGVIARYLSGQHYNPSPYYIKAWLLDMAAKNDINIDVGRLTTPNRMLYMPCASEYCKADTCYNGGTCQETHGGFTCNCKQGYDGNQCETEVIVVETQAYDNTTVVVLLSVILVLVILLVIVVLLVLSMKTSFVSKLRGKSTEEPYQRQTDTVSVT